MEMLAQFIGSVVANLLGLVVLVAAALVVVLTIMAAEWALHWLGAVA